MHRMTLTFASSVLATMIIIVSKVPWHVIPRGIIL